MEGRGARAFGLMDDEDEVRYTTSGDARLAFRARGHGPHAVVSVASWFSNQDFQPPAGRSVFWERLHSFARVVTYDARGTGLSDPVAGGPADLGGVGRRLACGGDGCGSRDGHAARERSGRAARGALRRDAPRTDARADTDQHV